MTISGYKTRLKKIALSLENLGEGRTLVLTSVKIVSIKYSGPIQRLY